MISLEQRDFMLKHKITPNQLLFLQLLYTRDYAFLYQYTSEIGKWREEEILSLEQRGFIYNENPDGGFDFDQFRLTNAAPEFEISYDRWALDFWEAYPKFITVNGRRIPAKIWNKEEFSREYRRRIRTEDDHVNAMKALKHHIQSGMIIMKIENYLKSELYKENLEHEQRKFPGEERVFF